MPPNFYELWGVEDGRGGGRVLTVSRGEAGVEVRHARSGEDGEVRRGAEDAP